ncbi:uncharacterized protein [Macrobrachium rosenbergii]|uniref:uncharacterized protein n=1 Tax=Macrobrachium rosenbergii TaxID=79674 RepID=UPI0034D424C1
MMKKKKIKGCCVLSEPEKKKMQSKSPAGYLYASLACYSYFQSDSAGMGESATLLCRALFILTAVSAVTPEDSVEESIFVIDGLLVYPPPFSPDDSHSQGLALNLHQRIGAAAYAEKNYDQSVTVDIYTKDWDDMETCPFWCQDEDGSLYCCPQAEEEEHAGLCPEKDEVCIRLSYLVHTTKSTRCANDAGCSSNEKCCFDRCFGARVCKTAIKS